MCTRLVLLNDAGLDAPEDDAYDLVMAVAAGEVADVHETARQLEQWGS